MTVVNESQPEATTGDWQRKRPGGSGWLGWHSVPLPWAEGKGEEGEERRPDGGSCCSLGVTYRRERHICNSWQANKSPASHYHQQQDAWWQDVCPELSAVSSRQLFHLLILSKLPFTAQCNKYIMNIIISILFVSEIRSKEQQLATKCSGIKLLLIPPSTVS